MRDSLVGDNSAVGYRGGAGGGIALARGSAEITRSAIVENLGSYSGGGISAGSGSQVTLVDGTVSGNAAPGRTNGGFGGAISADDLVLRQVTVTGNYTGGFSDDFDRPAVRARRLDLADSIVAGNFTGFEGEGRQAADLLAPRLDSNGQNLLGSVSERSGELAPGDRAGIAAARVFEAIDPGTGGGLLAQNGGSTPTVALRNALDNPALSGASSLTSSDTDQRGVARPQPEGSRADLGAFELDQDRLSTRPSAGNDVITGTADTDNILALSGNDLVRGLGGSDFLSGGAGGDLLEGGWDSDLLDGGSGFDVLLGGIGDDELEAGLGKDRLVGGPGFDIFDFETVADSVVGAGRDVIQAFSDIDSIDLSSIDAKISTPRFNDVFTLLAPGSAFTAAGQVRVTRGEDGGRIVQANVGGSLAPELEIGIGHSNADADDFLL